MFCRTFFLRLRQVFGSIVFGSIRMLRNVTQTIYTSRWSSRWWIGKWKCDLFSSNWFQIWPIWSNCLDFTIESLFATQKCKFRNRGLDHAKDYLVKRNVFWNSWYCQCSCVHLATQHTVHGVIVFYWSLARAGRDILSTFLPSCISFTSRTPCKRLSTTISYIK